MARKTARPGRTLVVFFAVLAITYGLVALGGSWKPALGLDLQGGTRITLIAKGSPRRRASTRPRSIIDQRVNGSGVSEAEVTTQGNQFIVVEIPGKSRRDLVDTVKRQAQLRFRLVACTSQSPACGGQPRRRPDTAPSAAAPGARRPPSGAAQQPATGKPKASPSASPKNRAPLLAAKPRRRRRRPRRPAASPSPSASAGVGQPVGQPVGRPGSALRRPLVDQPLKWMASPDPASVKAFNAFSARRTARRRSSTTTPTKPLVTCGTGDDAAHQVPALAGR